MIDLPDYGYESVQFSKVDSGGTADGSLGGPSDYIDRPGIRFGVQFTLSPLRSRDEARIFQSLLEQGSREDVSYPWPLDIKSLAAGTPLIDGSSAPGATIPLKGLTPGFQMRLGQPLAVILTDGSGSIQKATAATSAADDGTMTLPVFPWTRTTFADGLTVEIERPRIRGILSWDGAAQGTTGSRPFTFTITERA